MAFEVSTVPEPQTLGLVMGSLAALVLVRRRVGCRET